MTSALILLAAGSSSRLSQAKQLLRIGDETMLEHSIKVALKSGITDVIVVIGSNADNHRQYLNQFPIKVIYNENWSKGMGNSIKAAIKKIINSKLMPDCVVIMVCDQPMITSQNIKNLLLKHEETSYSIVASAYNNTTGVPALFDKSVFNELLSLEDEHGAKKIIQKHAARVGVVDCPEGTYDIDTVDDYQNFINFDKTKNHLL